MESLELTVLMPCLNEEVTLENCIQKVQQAMKKAGISGEVLISDNMSTDNSPTIAQEAGARVIVAKEKGYGSALDTGFQNALGKYIIMGDADSSYDFGSIPEILDQLHLGADLVMGNRFKGGIEKGAMPWKNRYIGNPILSFLGRILFNIPVKDFHCGLRGINKEAYHKLGMTSPGMEFASEMVIKSSLLNQCIKEIPTVLRKDGRTDSPRLRPWRDGWRHLRLMLSMAPGKTLKLPGVIITILGLLSWLILLPGMFSVSGVNLDVHTLLFSSTFLTIGPLLIFLSSFGKIYARNLGLLPLQKSFLQKKTAPEMMLLFGIIAILSGIACACVLINFWSNKNFGDLETSSTMRWAIPSVTLIILGVESLAASILLRLINTPPPLRQRR